MSRYHWWKVFMSSDACSNSEANNHVVSSLVPSYPVHLTKYSSLHVHLQLSNFKSKMFSISYSGLPSMIAGGGRGAKQSGMVFRWVSLICEMWKMGWTACMESGRWRVTECMPGLAITSKGPRNFSESLGDGLVIWRCLAVT